MKTNKQAAEEARRIRAGEFPDIGLPYIRILSDAHNGHLATHVTLPAWIETFPDMIPIAKRLQGMGLIDHRYRLTKLGTTYYSGHNRGHQGPRHAE